MMQGVSCAVLQFFRFWGLPCRQHSRRRPSPLKRRACPPCTPSGWSRVRSASWITSIKGPAVARAARKPNVRPFRHGPASPLGNTARLGAAGGWRSPRRPIVRVRVPIGNARSRPFRAGRVAVGADAAEAADRAALTWCRCRKGRSNERLCRPLAPTAGTARVAGAGARHSPRLSRPVQREPIARPRMVRRSCQPQRAMTALMIQLMRPRL
jgi:hypothetical protein